MIHFVHPEAFLLAGLLALVVRRRFLSTTPATVLRALLVLLLAAILADPYAATDDTGRDLVVVIDRSRSMPAAATGAAEEALDRAAKAARKGDRVGVVVFGREAAVEHPPREGFRRLPLSKAVDPDGTDLAEAIDVAIASIPPGRPGSILLVSDGEGTGEDPERAARRAARRGVRIDAQPVRRVGTFDVAVENLSLPPEVAAGEPFQIAAWVRSDRPVETTVRLLRDGKPVAEGKKTLHAGVERVIFRDVSMDPGIHEMAVEVVGANDRVAENDRAKAALRVAGRFRVLCVTPGGRKDRLTESLVASGLDVAIASAGAAPLSLDGLDGFRALVLEDVPAADLAAGAMLAIATWVKDHGGGLLMTGGQASYGPGGYHRSPIEDVLPVSLEMRQEQRKFALAMAIVLDRSGSMAIEAPGGPTKMDLANRGTCAAIDLLTALDAVSVIAVDSEPHVVVPLAPVVDKGGIKAKVLTIESMGGGIFVSTGIHAGAQSLKAAAQGTRHLVLFADANDAEEPGDYLTFVPALRSAGVTVSVIGLGTDHDSGAAFLTDVARLGGGRIFFAAEAGDLPRVFAQETIQVARSAMVEEPTAVATLPDLASIGALGRIEFPSVGGYTIAYLKPQALAGLKTRDEVGAPLVSFQQKGLGRAAAFLGVADGKLSGGLSTWKGYADFFSTLVRWTAGTEATDEVHVTSVRRGHEGLLAVEVPTGRDDLLARIEARVTDPAGRTTPVDLVRTGATRLEGRFPLAATGIHRPVVGAGDGRFVRASPMELPYSPEFEPRLDPSEGEATLKRIAALSGGRIDAPTGALFDGPRESRTTSSLIPTLALLAVFAFLLEIAVRRTSWVPRFAWARSAAARLFRRRRRPRAVPEGTSPAATPDAASIAGAAAARGGRRVKADAGARLDAPPPPPPGTANPPPPPPPPEDGGIAGVMERLRRKKPE